MNGSNLEFSLIPRLAGSKFDEKGEASFTLCNSCTVVYHNESKKNTYGEEGVSVYKMELSDGLNSYVAEGNAVGEELAKMIREGRMKRIDAYLA